MSNKDRVETVVIISGILAIVVSFFCPIIISAWTGDWFYMFLFLISWIPTLGVILLLKFILHIIE